VQPGAVLQVNDTRIAPGKDARPRVVQVLQPVFFPPSRVEDLEVWN